MAVSDVAASRISPLLTRIVVGALLIAVALAAVYFGGFAFTALVSVAVLLMFAEWCVMHGITRGWRLAGLLLLAVVVVLVPLGPATMAVIVLAAGAAALGLFARSYDRQRAFWVASGVLYCGLPAIALLWLRALPMGFALALWTLALVWTADIAAFTAGRAIGGARFVPTISPNKTWAGVIGAVLATALVAPLLAAALTSVAAIADLRLILFVMGGALAALAVLGDLLESWLKRRAGVKDSGTLLPGHGGVLDRLDGLVPVSIAAALVVALHSAVV